MQDRHRRAPAALHAMAGAAVLSAGLLLGAAGPSRPHDPWVFRCVLDKEARMVVVALHEQLWAAYDATDCTLAKVWDGDVKFDGAVYTTVHGPQPTSEGIMLQVGVKDHAWSVSLGGKEVHAAAVWKGYRFDEGDDGRVTLMYGLKLDDGSVIDIAESPEFAIVEGDNVAIDRRFRVSGAPEGAVISVGVHAVDPRGKAIEVLVNGRKASSPAGDGSSGGDVAAIPLELKGPTTIRCTYKDKLRPKTEVPKGGAK